MLDISRRHRKFKRTHSETHFSTKHPGYCRELHEEAGAEISDQLAEQLKKQQIIVTKQSKTQQTETKVSFIVAYNIANKNRAFVDSVLLKKCMLYMVEIVCPENKKVSLVLVIPGGP